MELRTTMFRIFLALCFQALAVQSGLADNWASIQRFEPSVKSLKPRFWNDDLEPCIMKYCLRHQMETRLYMKCIRRHCPSGLVTVPRDLENEVGKMLNGMEAVTGPPARAPWPAGGLVAGKVNLVCAKLYCGFWKEGPIRDQCARDTCSVRQLAPVTKSSNVIDNSSAVFWKWLATRVRTSDQRAGTRGMRSAVRDMCGLVLCAGRHGADLLTCVEERCMTSESLPSADRNHRSAERADDADFHDVSRHSALSTGSEGLSLGDDNIDNDNAERTLKRKRRINDDVSQCIQSYCGSQGSRTARLACIVRSCHRAG